MKKNIIFYCFFAFILCTSYLSSVPETNNTRKAVRHKEVYSFDIKSPFGSSNLNNYYINVFNLCVTQTAITSFTVGGIEVTNTSGIPGPPLCGGWSQCIANNPGPDVVLTLNITPSNVYYPAIYYVDPTGNHGPLEVTSSGQYTVPVTLSTTDTSYILIIPINK
jgi:hypothetical protein